MRFHKEGRKIMLIVTVLGLAMIFWAMQLPATEASILLLLFIIILIALVFQFFRDPLRLVAEKDAAAVLAPADGRVVVIEKTEESEYFQDERIQLSIFMSPLNVHVNRYPVSGVVRYVRHHAGKYLKAWNPKSSLENERSTIVLENEAGQILVRQIAGAVARRIITYSQEGETAVQGEDLGFIRFGSRVDVFLPTDAEVLVSMGDKCVGNVTRLANLKNKEA